MVGRSPRPSHEDPSPTTCRIVPSLLRLLTTHSPLPTLFLSPLCFLSLTNPFSRLPDHPILCFHVLTNPLAGNPFIFTSIQNPRGVTPSLRPLCSHLSALWVAVFPAARHFPFVFIGLPPLFQARSLCFQPFTASFRKTPGVGWVDAVPHYPLPTTHCPLSLLIPQPAWWRRVRGYRCE
jgi:hypothetical protein